MKRRNWNGLLVAAVPFLLLGLPTSAGTAPVAKVTPKGPHTLVSERGLIHSFAQDAESIAWIGPKYKVHVRSLLTRQAAVVGSAAPATGSGPAPALAVAGTRALWSKSEGGNAPETSLWTSTLGARATGIDLFMGGSGDPGGISLTGVAGDGSTLLYGRTEEGCSPPPWPPQPCPNLEATGGVVFVTGQYSSSAIATIPPPAMIAFAAHDPRSGQISQGMLALAPAASPLLSDLYRAPRVAENGPVQVYRFLNQVVLSSSVAPHGFVKAIALSFQQLAVLVQRANGPRLIERYNPTSGAIIGTTPVSSSTAFELGISSAGIVYRVGTKIFFVGPSGVPKLAWKARAQPIGLSIEGKRIAWAENVGGHGRIVALTAPGSAQVAASAHGAASPKRNGDILFGSIRVKNGSRLLYLMGPNGTHQRRIGVARNVWSPAWSPGGSWIAYGATPRNGGLCPQLYVTRADGTHTRRLTHARNCYLNPTWAPGGKRIAFEVWGGAATPGIWAMNVDGSGLRLLTDKGNTPAWSPDGKTIAFRGALPEEAIWLMDADGTNLRPLPTPHGASAPAWSPNGKWIAFSAGNIYVIRSDGTGLRQLTAHTRSNTMPAWSPDGTRIVFVSDRAHRDLGDIYVMKADGTGQKRLTRNVDNQWPDWRARR